MDCFSSHRFERIAFEVKVSRRDFAMEIDHPEKRLSAEKIANRCYFVVPQGLVARDEVPEKWGLMEVNKAGLRKAKNGQWRDVAPLSMAHIANLLLRHPEKSEHPAGDMDFWKVAGQAMSLEEFEKMVDDKAFCVDPGVEKAPTTEDIIHEATGDASEDDEADSETKNS